MSYTTPPITPDYISAITAQIAATILANTFVTGSLRLKLGNTITKLRGVKFPAKVTAQAGEFPQLTIEIPRDDILNANTAKTFDNVVGAGCDKIITEQITINIVVIWESLDRNQPNQFGAVFKGMFLRDATLGITAIRVQESGRFTMRITEEKSARTFDSPRLVQIIDFPITLRLHKADLIALAAYTGD